MNRAPLQNRNYVAKEMSMTQEMCAHNLVIITISDDKEVIKRCYNNIVWPHVKKWIIVLRSSDSVQVAQNAKTEVILVQKTELNNITLMRHLAVMQPDYDYIYFTETGIIDTRVWSSLTLLQKPNSLFFGEDILSFDQYIWHQSLFEKTSQILENMYKLLYEILQQNHVVITTSHATSTLALCIASVVQQYHWLSESAYTPLCYLAIENGAHISPYSTTQRRLPITPFYFSILLPYTSRPLTVQYIGNYTAEETATWSRFFTIKKADDNEANPDIILAKTNETSLGFDLRDAVNRLNSGGLLLLEAPKNLPPFSVFLALQNTRSHASLYTIRHAFATEDSTVLVVYTAIISPSPSLDKMQLPPSDSLINDVRTSSVSIQTEGAE